MTAAQQEHRSIRLEQISIGKTNPRKHFDKEKLAELTASVRQVGILQPIIVRRMDNGYQLIAGERRLRAAKAAGLIDISANVLDVTEAQVLHIQVIENLQREDLHPLEEAEGYEKLLKAAKPDGSKYTVDEIAAEVGKSRSYIFGRLKLTALCPAARDAFYDGKLNASTALLVARIHGADLQKKAAGEITGMSARQASEHVQRTYMLQLAQAPFDVKVVYFAGTSAKPIGTPCGECPKRTGSQPELFADVKSADVCTDPGCFQAKTAAALELKAKEAKANGQEVITGKDAKAIMPWAYGGSLARGYVRLDSPCYDDPKRRTYAQLVRGEAKPALLQNPHDSAAPFIEVIDVASIKAILKEKGALRAPVKRATAKKKPGAGPTKQELEAEYRRRLFLAVMVKCPAALDIDCLRMLANDQLEVCDDGELVNAVLISPPTPAAKLEGKKEHQKYQLVRDAIEKAIPKMDAPALVRLIMANLLVRAVERPYGDEAKKILEAAKRWKVNPDAIKKAVETEAKEKAAAAKAAAKAKKPAPAKKAKKKTAMAASFERANKGKVHQPSVIPVITPLIKPPGWKKEDAEKRPAKKNGAKRTRPMGAFMKPMQPSEQLAAIVGDKPMPRTEITSKVWAYIKKHGLQDAVNKRNINTDDNLRAIFKGKKSVSMFEMTKLISAHLK